MTWQFNALDFEPSAGFELWPEGWFPIIITKAEEKPNKDGDGMLWELSIKGLPGSPVADKVQAIRINHKNKSEQARAAAHSTMSAIALCCGVPQFQHPGQLANIPFQVKSTLQAPKKDEQGNELPRFNNFRDFKNMAGIDALDIYKQMKGIPTGGGAPQQPQQPQQGFAPPAGQPQGGFAPQQPQQTGFAPQPPQGGFAPPQQPTQPAAAQPQQGAWPTQPQQPQQPPMQPQQPQGGFPQQPMQPAGVQPMQPQQGFQPQPGAGAPQPAGNAPWGG